MGVKSGVGAKGCGKGQVNRAPWFPSTRAIESRGSSESRGQGELDGALTRQRCHPLPSAPAVPEPEGLGLGGCSPAAAATQPGLSQLTRSVVGTSPGRARSPAWNNTQPRAER